MEMLESLGNLAEAEFLPFGAFLGFFCKISTPVYSLSLQIEMKNLLLLQVNERKVVTIRSGSTGMPILPKDSGNILKIALPTSDSRIQKTQRIILPSESVKVIEATSGTTSHHLPLPAHLAHLAQPRKVRESHFLQEIKNMV